MSIYRRIVKLPVSAARAFAWHEEEGAFEKLTPPWEKIEVLKAEGGIAVGAFIEVKVSVLGPIYIKARYRHTDYKEGTLFVDEQEKGPFLSWRHEHRFRDVGEGCSELDDHIEFVAPFGSAWLVKRRLERMFSFRHEVTLRELSADDI